MKKRLFVLALSACLLILSLITIRRPAASAGSLNVSLEEHATGFSSAVDIAHHGTNRLFIVEQDARIRIIQPLGNVIPTPFLDIDGRVLSAGEGGAGSEQGLLGLAFHPDYAENGYFYVYYTRDAAGTGGDDGDIVVSRFSVTGDPDVADPNSEVILLVIDHPDAHTNHNGGGLEFGPDGYLYISVGDGGSGGDPWDNGQMTEVLLGKILRIDVDVDNRGANPPDNCSISGANYSVPADNPFVDGTGGDCDEIWAWGLRNPWRFAFDSLTGDLFIGDVGQNAWEEIDYQPAASAGGENYGWDCYEGNAVYNDGTQIVPCGDEEDYTFPIAVHGHSGTSHCSVTGGEVYRGALYPEMYGHYLFIDYCSGHFWSLVPAGGNSWTKTFLDDFGFGFPTLGTRKDGEVFLSDGSTIFHVVEDTLAPTETPTPTNTPTPTQIAPVAPFGLNLVEVGGGFAQPSIIANAGGPELYIGEKTGTVRSINPPDERAGGTLFLDISDRVEDEGFQQGLLGLAFDPDYGSNGYFYVNYTDAFSSTVISRFTLAGTPEDTADTEEVLMSFDQPFTDNNGGGLAFGPDGNLYIAVGDGGGVNDPGQRAQDIEDLHGKVLRIDVHGGEGAPECDPDGAYTVPASNPFVGSAGCDEIWQVGFRNIWGISFDSLTDDLWIADVGANLAEEVNIQPAGDPGGSNYGWSCYEGVDEGPNFLSCGPGPYVFPLYTFDHQAQGGGRSITGGYVYRGADYPIMQGFYLFGDFVFGKIWSLDLSTGTVFEHHAFAGSFSAFGRGADGRLYVADYGSGSIYLLEAVEPNRIRLPMIIREP